MKRKPAVVLVYLLGMYVLFQFCWWGFHIIELTKATKHASPEISKRVFMIISEGAVFISLLIIGLLYIIRSIKKDIKLAIQQQHFMLSVTHELKTPVAANKLYIQTLLKHNLSEEKEKELLQKSLNENNRLEGLVNQILTAAQLDQGDISSTSTTIKIESFIRDIIAIQQERNDIPIELESNFEGTILTDAFMLGTILSNLIENAIKYGKTEQGIHIQLNKLDIGVLISVRDFGKGIAPENQSLLFRKFTRLENEETRSTKGTGLGLFIAYEMSKKLRGNLQYKAQKNSGACFQLYLPYE